MLKRGPVLVAIVAVIPVLFGTFDRASCLGAGRQSSADQAGIKLMLPAEAGIEGVVVEKASGKPVGGVYVAAYPDRRQSAALPGNLAITAPDGTFRIGGLSAGQYVLELSAAPGQVAEWVAEEVRLSVKAGETTSGVRMQVTKGAILEVLVKDPTGKPVDNVHVYLRPTQRERSLISGDTDANGLARIRVIAGGYTALQLYRRGYTSCKSTEQMTVEEGQTKRIECTLSPTPIVTGIVRDEAGNPLAGVQVQATWSRSLSSFTAEERSDASGMFEITGYPSLTERDTVVVFVARDLERNLAQALDIDERVGPLDLKLKPGVVVAGTVLDQEGKPVRGASARVELRMSKATVPLGWAEPAPAGPNGVFEVKAIPPGREYAVTISAYRYVKRTISINVLNPKENRHDVGPVKLTRGNLSVSGIVVDPNGNPVADAQVSTSGEGQPDLWHANTDAQGRFTIKGVCPGPIGLHADSPGARTMYGDAQAEGGATDVKIITSKKVSPNLVTPD